MTDLPLVTVMIPTYNQAEYLAGCIDSALGQDYANLEIIIGNDCSTDRTAELLQSLNDPRIRIVNRSRNIGRVANYRSLLQEHARGEWVLNLDGDDYLLGPGGISLLVNLTQKDPQTVMAFGQVSSVNGNQQPGEELPANSGPEVLEGKSFVLNYWNNDRGLKHAGVLYRREAAISVGFYEHDIISSDIESLLRLAIEGRGVRTARTIAAWRHHDDNASASTNLQARIRNLLLVDTVGASLESVVDEGVARRWRRRMRFRMAYGTVVRLLRFRQESLISDFVREAFPSKKEQLFFVLSPRYVLRRVLHQLRVLFHCLLVCLLLLF